MRNLGAGLFVLAVLLAARTPRAATALVGIEHITPRPFGYVIGDEIHHRVRLELNHPYRLVTEALPEAGRLNYWLELRPPRIDTDERNGSIVYEIVLSYQIINLQPGMRTLYTPAFKLYYSDGQGRLITPLKAWLFTVNPITNPALPPDELRPDRPPPAIALQPYRLLVPGILLLAALLGLAYSHWTLPFLARHNGPFARACRQLSSLQQQPWDAARQRQALRLLHQAFNQTTGQTLFSENLDTFFTRAPRFTPQRQAIEMLFAQSRAVFFEPGIDSHTAPLLADLLRLCRACRDVERGLA